MTLKEIRSTIDEIDLKIRELLMLRLNCSERVAFEKISSGDINIFRPDREEEILNHLGKEVPDERRAGYLSVVRKIMETSRMYQYGIIYDELEDLFSPLAKGIEIKSGGTRVKVRLSRDNRPNAMSSILSMIGDYGFNMDKMELISQNKKTVTFDLLIIGDLSKTKMKKLMFQLSKESKNFKIIECY